MVVLLYGVEICMYSLTFGGLTMFCGILLLTPVLRSGNFIVSLRLLFAAPACIWEGERKGACDNWEETL